MSFIDITSQPSAGGISFREYKFGRGIPREVMHPLRALLMNSSVFKSDGNLQAVFADSSITMWKNSIPGASSVAGRVDNLIAFLHTRSNRERQNGLMLFLEALSWRVSSDEGTYQDLLDLKGVLDSLGGGASQSGSGSTSPTMDKRRLFAEMSQHFSADDLKDLCFEMGIEYDDIGGMGRRAKIRELIKKLGFDSRLPELVATCKELKPKGNWA